MNPDQDLAAKRDRLFSAEQFHRDQAQLLAKRDELDEKILTAQNNLDKSINNRDLEQSKRELTLLKQEVRAVDSLLDEWDELSENQLYRMREELLNEIWERYPDQYSAEILLWNELKTTLILGAEIQTIRKLIDRLLEILHLILQERSGIKKGKGLLRYIFGVSPNAVIERHLFYAHDIILNALPDLKQAIHRSSQTALQPIFQAIYHEFYQLKDHCKAVWGFRHIDTVISSSEKQIALFSKELQEREQATQKRAVELKRELDDWLGLI